MAIEYYIQFPCQVRSSVSDEDLLRMEKSRDRAMSVLDAMQRNPQTDRSKPESEWTVVVRTMGPQGPADTMYRLQELFRESAPLEALAAHCPGCIANLQNRNFGCGGAVHYPITAAAEKWLVSRLPNDLNAPRGALMMRMLKNFQFDSAAVNASRGRSELHESSRPVERQWKTGLLSRTRIDSSQLLHMLFGVGSLQPGHAKFLGLLFGFSGDDGAIDRSPENQAQPNDQDRVAEFKRFLSAAAFAGQHGVTLLVDA